jgi:hypothetical protein
VEDIESIEEVPPVGSILLILHLDFMEVSSFVQ